MFLYIAKLQDLTCRWQVECLLARLLNCEPRHTQHHVDTKYNHRTNSKTSPTKTSPSGHMAAQRDSGNVSRLLFDDDHENHVQVPTTYGQFTEFGGERKSGLSQIVVMPFGCRAGHARLSEVCALFSRIET